IISPMHRLQLSHILLAAVAAFPSSILGQNQCSDFVGRKVAPLPFNVATSRLAKLSPKGEFESTDQFETRRRVQLGGIGSIAILKEPEDQGFFDYDADAQVLR